ncbi:PHB depolymerase family esterase [Kutzneria viridogrisea]|uniref:Polyhydroxybutyrate depolymerase n=1 Tax=Kutzneria viridogrisea TaxID=47990 RepID=A0ABR6B8P2_9PSEU|nr:polyhydroxybutyrate depolymerase [Kutzneria viridogrisea]
MRTALLSVLAVVASIACTPTHATPTADTGCSVAPPTAPGSTASGSITSGGLHRDYLVHVPANYEQGKAVPMVLAFHGRGQSDQLIETYSGLDALPAITVYPQGTATSNGQAGWQGAPYSSGADDVRFTEDLISSLRQQVCVDSHRVYATGKSNGGGFVGVLGCRLSTRIAAIAPVAAAFYDTGQQCAPQRPMPVLDFHGTADSVIPYQGAPDRKLPSIPDWLTGWAGRDGCTSDPATFFTKEDVTGERWSGCRGGSEVQHYKVTGGDHTWPGTASKSGPGHTTQTIKATDLMWQFFGNHVLP